MTKNLLKSPLIAIFLGGLIYFSGVVTLYSDTYKELLGEFAMSTAGYIFLIIFSLWVTITAAVAFGATEKGGMKFILLFSLPLIFATWGIPVMQPLLFGQSAGIAGLFDSLIYAGIHIVCTILAIILFVIVFKMKQPNEKQAPKTVQIIYKLKPLDLIIKLIVLPLIYTALFFAAWYFLHWNSAEVREFYGGMPENPGFIPSVVNLLLDYTWMFPLALLKGLLYSLLALPMLFILHSKRIVYIIITVMINLAGPVWMLVPSPLMPDNIRMSNAIYNAALIFVFSVVSAVLLQLSYNREEQPIEAPKPQMTERERAIAVARARAAAAAKAAAGTAGAAPTAQQATPTVQQAAAVVSDTMAGKA